MVALRICIWVLAFGVSLWAQPIHAEKKNFSSLSPDQLAGLISKNQELLDSGDPNFFHEIDTTIGLAMGSGYDTLLVKSLILRGQGLMLKGHKTGSMDCFSRAMALSDSIGFSHGKCISVLETGRILYQWGQYNDAYPYFIDALKLSQQYHFAKEKVSALNFIGKYYHTKGEFKQSVVYYEKAIEAGMAINDSSQLTTLYLNLGKTRLNAGDYYMAMRYYLKANEYSIHKGNALARADVLNHLGSIHLLFRQYSKSLEYHTEALNIRMALNAQDAIASSHNNIGETYLAMKKPDSAMFHFEESYHYCQQSGYRKGAVKASSNMGRSYQLINNHEKALQCLLISYKLAIEAGYEAGIFESALGLGQSYLFNNEYVEAIRYFELGLRALKAPVMKDLQVLAYNGLYKAYKQTGQTHQAMMYLEKAIEAERSVMKAENDRQLAELRVAFDLERKENEFQLLHHENQLKEMAIKKRTLINWLIGSFLFMAIFLAVNNWGRYRQKQKANQKLNALNNELELAIIEKDKMFAIIAHELRNPLYWFQNLTEVVSRQHAKMPEERLRKSLLALDESAKNAFHLMDNLLNWSRAKLNRATPRKEILDLKTLMVETLALFESIINQKGIQVNMLVEDNLKVLADANMLACVLRNLFSNAIKYTPEKGSIVVNSLVLAPFCMVTINDSGIGIEENKANLLFERSDFESQPGLMQEKGSGLGLKLCKEFVQLNGGDIWALPGQKLGASFQFTIPMN
jgi:signal transduction histidine kinase